MIEQRNYQVFQPNLRSKFRNYVTILQESVSVVPFRRFAGWKWCTLLMKRDNVYIFLGLNSRAAINISAKS